MEAKEMLTILERASRLKSNTRHNWDPDGRQESVADHSWRISLMAMLLDGVEEFKGTDLNKVIRMCLIHDLGEAFTGDIPTFDKTEDDSELEERVYLEWVDTFPSPQKEEWLSLLAEMKAMETREAKTYKALDKLEALIAHNETDIETWLPLEYDLQLTYGKSNMAFSQWLSVFREEVDKVTRSKIKAAQEKKQS